METTTASKPKASTLQIVLIVIGIIIACVCLAFAGVTAAGYYSLQTGVKSAQSALNNSELRSGLANINLKVVTYYASNGKYPDTLKDAGAEDTVKGVPVNYRKINDMEYGLSITLSDGSTYNLGTSR